MRILQLTPLAKARVWSEHMLTSGFAPDGVLTAPVGRAADSPPTGEPLLVGIEALVPRGPRAEYGLLALSFARHAVGPLEIEVPYSVSEGPVWTASLAGTLDEVRIGLPAPYANAVLEALSPTAVGRLPPGLLRVAEAAHGAVGSSPRFFGKLARAAVELVEVVNSDLPEERLIELLRSVLVA